MEIARSGAASGGQLEEKVDWTAETDEKIPQAESMAKAGQLAEALALLANLEKKCRVGNDSISLVRVCKASLQICSEAKDVDALISTLDTLSTRRSQKTAAVKALVQTALPWCVVEPYEPLPVSNDAEKANRDRLVKCLRDITDGKIFLEKERAQLTRALSKIKEQEGDIIASADIIQEVHVETYGSLSKKDKVEFILEQIRLVLAKKDFVRAYIVAGKVSRKHLAEESMEEYKVRFFTLLAEYHRHEMDALELAKDYHAIYSTPHILNDEALWKQAMQATVLFLCLASFGNEQQDLMHKIKLDSNLEKLPACKIAIDFFLKKEIINYPMPPQAELEALPVFAMDGLAEHWHEIFHRRIIQHNVRIASLYYQRIHGSRLAQLLQLEPTRLEREIADMVSEGAVYAKIDRPKDIIRFAAPKSSEAILSEWAADIDKVLHLVETTAHLIHKENMTAAQ